MNRKFAVGLLVSFFALLFLVIAGFFIPLGRIAPLVYTLFIFELFFIVWFAVKKRRK